MIKPIVSICIPTLNRCDFLKKTIESIVVQPEFINGYVEIVISDNASTDNTKNVVESLREKYPAIIYHRNEINIGNANFPLVLSLGNGILRKLNNDTLMLSENSLGALCEFVIKYKEKRPVLFFPNGEVSPMNNKILSFREFVTAATYWITWIGGFSIWESDCDGLKDDTAGCEEKLWQVRKVYELASEKDEAVLYDIKYGHSQMVEKKDVRYGIFQIFYVNYMKFLRPYFERGSMTKEDIEKVERDLLFDFFLDWMIRWEFQDQNFRLSETEDLNASIEAQYKDKPYWKKFVRKYQYKKLKTRVKRFIKGILGEKRKNGTE